jgi:hypothetical protein
MAPKKKADLPAEMAPEEPVKQQKSLTHEQMIDLVINNIRNDIGTIGKDAKNSFHGYKYTSEAGLMAKLNPVLTKYGLVKKNIHLTIEFDDRNGNTTVIVDSELSHSVTGAVYPKLIQSVGVGQDRSKNGKDGDKGLYAALTGANKYFWKELLQLTFGDDAESKDQNQHSQPPAKPNPDAVKWTNFVTEHIKEEVPGEDSDPVVSTKRRELLHFYLDKLDIKLTGNQIPAHVWESLYQYINSQEKK